MIKYSIEDLVTVAKRDNNTKRPYLYVNPIQGKHIPVTPSKTMSLFKYMGNLLQENYPNEQILIIGFAETATAVGAGISYFADNVHWCMQTTRECYNDAKYLYFTESHSHATEQSLIVNELEAVLKKADRIVFAEDEVTTGNTIIKLINSINDMFPNIGVKYSIFSILNSMTEQRLVELREQEIDCLFVDKIPFEYKIQTIENYMYSEIYDSISEKEITYKSIKTDCLNLRYVHEKGKYCESVEKYVNDILVENAIDSVQRILVLGTEEFMFPPLMFAKRLEELFSDKEVKFHATSRSPILVSNSQGYPLFKRNRLVSFYDDERVTYVYNLKEYDLVFVLTDSSQVTESAVNSMCGALVDAGCKSVIIGKE